MALKPKIITLCSLLLPGMLYAGHQQFQSPLEKVKQLTLSKGLQKPTSSYTYTFELGRMHTYGDGTKACNYAGTHCTITYNPRAPFLGISCTYRETGSVEAFTDYNLDGMNYDKVPITNQDGKNEMRRDTLFNSFRYPIDTPFRFPESGDLHNARRNEQLLLTVVLDAHGPCENYCEYADQK